MAALYGLRPHELGLCGPKKAKERQLLKKFLRGGLPAARIKPILKEFKGAYPYYQLIAESNKIKNPFDRRVVSAYWLGNKLLDRVKVDDSRKMMIEKFSGPGLLSKKVAQKKAREIPENSKPHHSFHVLIIGSVTGSIDFKNMELRDICRIGWGKIKKLKIKNKKLKISVRYQPLIEANEKLKLGKPIKKEINWNRDLAPKVKVGDWVSFHWNYLVQVLTPIEVANLKKYTLNNLR